MGIADDKFDPAPILLSKPPQDEMPEPPEEEAGEQEEFSVMAGEVVKQKDPFEDVVELVKQGESPVVRKAIEDTPCFGRLWFAEDEQSYCTELGCHLRGLCEATYHQVIGYEKPVEDPAKAAAILRRKLLQQKQKRPAPPEVIPKRGYRYPYVDQGRPVDVFAKILWQELGQPPELPERWSYGDSNTLEERKQAKYLFTLQYGGGLQITRRSSYHQYFYEGLHLCRLWVHVASVGWLDCCPELINTLIVKGYRASPVIPKDKKHSFQYYKHKIRIVNEDESRSVAAVIKLVLDKLEVR